MPSSDSISDLQNLGPRSQEWLNAIGIHTLTDLEEVGAVEAYRQLKELDYPVTLNLVYGIQGALLNCPWNHLPPGVRDDLKAQVSELNAQFK